MRFVLPLAVAALAGAIAAQESRLPERRLIGPADQAAGQTYPLDLRAHGLVLPRITGNRKMDALLHDSRTVFYKLPQVYQQYVPEGRIEAKNLVTGDLVRSSTRPVWSIYRTSVLPETNANPDFPWEVTFGLNLQHRLGKVGDGKLYDTFNFLALPEDDDGRLIPVAVLDERPVKWLFPPGTVVGEVLYVRNQGVNYIQEIRTRTKNANSETWFPGVFRPLATREEFALATGIHKEPNARYMQFRNPEEDEVFEIHGTVERLPAIPPATVRAILSRPFQDVTGSNWSPAPDQDFSILPRDYSLGIINPIDSQACANCHRQTQISARNLTPNEAKIKANPLKVGNIRGCDAVFTWHPFSYRSVLSQEGEVGRNIYVRAFDVRNGIVQVVGREQRPERDYKLTAYVERSLKPYERPAKRFLHHLPTCDCYPKCDCDPCECGKDMAIPVLQDNRRIVTDLDGRNVQVIRRLPVGARWQLFPNPNTRGYRAFLIDPGPPQRFLGAWDQFRQVYLPVDDAQRQYLEATEPPLPIPEFMRNAR